LDDESLKDHRAFSFAAQSNHLDIVERLLQDARLDPSAFDEDFTLQWACANGHTHIVEKLLQDDRVTASERWVDRMFKPDQHTALFKAASRGHLQIVRKLVETCYLPRGYVDIPLQLAFLSALKHNHIELAKQLQKYVHLSDFYKAAILIVEKGQLEMLETLLQEDLDPSLQNNKLLRTAKKKGHKEIVTRLLLDPRVDSDAEDDD
jgi:ankyrin repeat protein